MLLFVDTEFTSLDAQAQLLSIGLVSEADQSDYLYREITGVHQSQCSDFVLEHVLPHMQGGEIAKEFQRVALDVWHWIAERGKAQPVQVAVDFAGDWAWVALLLDVAYQYGAPSSLPHNLHNQPRNIWPVIGAKETRKLADAWMRDNCLKEHHALHDAFRNRMAYLHFSNINT